MHICFECPEFDAAPNCNYLMCWLGILLVKASPVPNKALKIVAISFCKGYFQKHFDSLYLYVFVVIQDTPFVPESL